jgi:hypothetical protein
MTILPEHRADSSVDAVFRVSDVRACPNGSLREFSRTMAGRAEGHGEIAGRFPSEWSLLSGTRFAHRPRYDIAKLAITWPGLADAGSVLQCRHWAKLPVAEVGLRVPGAWGVFHY